MFPEGNEEPNIEHLVCKNKPTFVEKYNRRGEEHGSMVKGVF